MVDVVYIFDELLRLGEKESIMPDLRYINLPLLRYDLEILLNNAVNSGMMLFEVSGDIQNIFYRIGRRHNENYFYEIDSEIQNILSNGGYPIND